MDVVILGNGGHGRDVEDIALACGCITRFLDDRTGEPTDSPLARGECYAIGVWDPTVRATLDRDDAHPATLVHPSASLGANVKLGAGVVIGAGVRIGPDVTLGRHVHVGAGAILTRCTIGDYTTISNGANILGDVTIGERVMVGASVVVKNLRTIRDHARVGCGAVVVHDVATALTVKGNPAR